MTRGVFWLPNMPVQLAGLVPPQLDAVAYGKSRAAPARRSGGPAAERHIRWAATDADACHLAEESG